MSKKKVVWLCDVPGWAYSNRAESLKRMLPEYEHEIVFYMKRKHEEIRAIVATADLVIVNHPSAMQFVSDCGKSILMLTGMRGLQKPNITVLYYTDNTLDGTHLGQICRNLIERQKPKMNILSVSHEPLSFGNNLCVGKMERGIKTILEQIIEGLKCIGSDHLVFLAEHDCLYPDSHFAAAMNLELGNEDIAYDINHWRCTEGGYARHYPSNLLLSMAVGKRDTLLRAMKEKYRILCEEGRHAMRCLEPGRGAGCEWVNVKTYDAQEPSVDIRHSGCWSGQTRMPPDQQAIPFWGDCGGLRKMLHV